MTDQTDRIKQMAQEAGLAWLDDEGAAFTASRDCVDITDDLAKFAALVAEDLTADDDALAEKMAAHLYGHPRSDAIEWAKEDKFDSEKDKAIDLIAVVREHIRARYAIAKPPEAG